MDDVHQDGSACGCLWGSGGAKRDHQFIFDAALMISQGGGRVIKGRGFSWFVGGANNINKGRISRGFGINWCRDGLVGLICSWRLNREGNGWGGGIDNLPHL